MKGKIILALIGWALLASPTFASTFYLADDDITIDNVIDEPVWDSHKVISDKADNPNRTQFCWDTSIADWVETTKDDCTTYLYDPLGQIDLRNAWFGINEKNMLLAFETAVPMFAIQDMSTGDYLSIFNQEDIAALGITELPTAFDHDMVFAFDADPKTGEAASYNWYLVANIQYDIGGDNSDQSNFLQIVQDSGDTNGFQADEDTVVDTLDTSQSKTANGTEPTAVMEISQNVEHFYEVTGLASGDEVNFRLETHSSSGDTTKPVRLVFVDSNAITEDALVVGSGATAFGGRQLKRFSPATVTAYSLDDQSIQLQFDAYDKKVGAQVAVGDVTGDGNVDIVTLPFRAMPNPEWKVFDSTGTLEDSGTVPKEDGRRFQKYHLAVGDVDGDGQAEVVLSNGTGNRLMIDVLQYVSDDLSRVVQYNEPAQPYYAKGANVEVANIDTSDDAEEIVTTPTAGNAVLDVWSVMDGMLMQDTEYDIGADQGFAGGVHIAATDGAVLAVEHSSDGQLHMLVWDDATGTLTEGSLDSITGDDTLGKIGNIAWLESAKFAYSSFPKTTVSYHDYDAATGDSTDTTFDVGSRATFLDFFPVE